MPVRNSRASYNILVPRRYDKGLTFLGARVIHMMELDLTNKRPGKKRASRRESEISKVNTHLTPSREAISHNTLGVVTSRILKRASICVRQLMRNVVRHSFNLLPSP